MKYSTPFFSILCCFLFLSGYSQVRVNEEEVNIQKLFIEASREKLLENYDKAISLYQDIVKLDRSISETYFELSKLYDLKEDAQNAIDQINKAIEKESKNVWYYKHLAQLYQKKGQFEAAAEAYAKMIKLTSMNSRSFYFEQSELLAKAQKIEAAIKVLDDLEEVEGFSEEIARKKQALFLESGNLKKARKELERLIELYPNEVSYRHLLAKFYEQFVGESEAIKVYRTIANMDPNDQKAKMILATQASSKKATVGTDGQLLALFKDRSVDLGLKLDRLESILKDLGAKVKDQTEIAQLKPLTEALQEEFPENAKVLYYSGLVSSLGGDLNQAKDQLGQSLEVDDRDFKVWGVYMDVLDKMNSNEQLAETAENAIDLFPNEASSYLYFGRAKIALNDYDDAISYLSEAQFIVAGNAFDKGHINFLLGQAYLAKEDINAATPYFKEAIESPAKEDPVILEGYGDYLFQNNDVNTAVKYWKQSQSLGNTSELLKRKIADKKLYK